MRRILLSTLLFIATICTAFADEVSFVASAPKSVVVGQRFKIAYEANTRTDSQPTLPEVDGMRVLMGPSSSVMTQSSNINGRRTSSQTITFTYTVVIDNEGDVTIPGASVMVDGKNVVSNPVTIKVLPQGQSSSAQQGDGSAARQSSSTNISNDELFIVAAVSKTRVYDQEALLLTYKVYTTVNLVNLDNPTPDLKGFNIQEIELPQQRQFELEHYKGRNYNMMEWRKFVLFPQESGRLEIPSMEYNCHITRRVCNFKSAGYIQEHILLGKLESNPLFKHCQQHVHSAHIKAGSRALRGSICSGTHKCLHFNKERTAAVKHCSNSYTAQILPVHRDEHL